MSPVSEMDSATSIGNPRFYFVAFDLRLRLEADVVLEAGLGIEGTPIHLKRHMRVSLVAQLGSGY